MVLSFGFRSALTGRAGARGCAGYRAAVWGADAVASRPKAGLSARLKSGLKSGLKAGLSAALMLGLGACGSAPSGAPPAYSAATAPFAAGTTYVVWEVADPAIELSGDIWCPVDRPVLTLLRGRCFESGIFGNEISAFSTIRGAGHARIRVEGRLVDLLPVKTAGPMAPVGNVSGRRVSDGDLPAFVIVAGKVNYLGHYDSTQTLFRSGRWAPDGLREALSNAGRGDIADAMTATFPRSVGIACASGHSSRKTCEISDSNKLFPGLGEG